MIDFFGNTINIDDTVAFYAPGYRKYCRGTVYAFTPKQVRVKYNTWNYGQPGAEMTYLGYPNMFIKEIKENENNV